MAHKKQHSLSAVQLGSCKPDAHKGESRPNRQCKINKQECAAKQVTDWERSWEETYETLVELEKPIKTIKEQVLGGLQNQRISADKERLRKDGYVDLQVKQLNLTVLEHFTIFNEYAGLIPSGCNAEVIKHVHWSANTSLDLPALPYSKIMWTSKHTCWMVNSSTFEAVQQHAADFTHHLFGHMVLRTFTLKTLCGRMVSMDRSAAKCGSQQVLPKRMLQTSRVGFTQ